MSLLSHFSWQPPHYVLDLPSAHDFGCTMHQATRSGQQQSLPNETPSAWIAPYVLAVILPLALWLILAPQYMLSGTRLTDDSATYIDCARSIREGRGFQTRVYGGLKPQTWVPMRLFPPGYSILVAGVMALGLDPHSAALAVSVVCSGFFVIVVLSYYTKRLPFVVAARWGSVRLHETFARTSGPCA